VLLAAEILRQLRHLAALRDEQHRLEEDARRALEQPSTCTASTT